MSNKCSRCGVVNWQNSVECVRCKSLLGGAYNNEPSSKDSSAQSLNIAKIAGIVVCFCLCFAVFKMFSGSYTANDKAESTTNAETLKPNLDLSIYGKQDAELLKKLDAEMKKRVISADDWKKILPKATPVNPPMPYVLPGSYGPPGAGARYHTH